MDPQAIFNIILQELDLYNKQDSLTVNDIMFAVGDERMAGTDDHIVGELNVSHFKVADIVSLYTRVVHPGVQDVTLVDFLTRLGVSPTRFLGLMSAWQSEGGYLPHGETLEEWEKVERESLPSVTVIEDGPSFASRGGGGGGGGHASPLFRGGVPPSAPRGGLPLHPPPPPPPGVVLVPSLQPP